MRAAGIRALGEPVEILEVDELTPPGADEVLIDVAAAGVGNWDELVRIGSWRIGGPVPMALGTEAAGTVVAAGSGVAEVGEGDEVISHIRCRSGVMGRGRGGCLPRRRPSRPDRRRPHGKPAERSPFQRSPRLRHSTRLSGSRAAAGWSSTELAESRVACSSSSPRLAAPRVIATASARKAERIRGYGASEVVDYHGDWPALVREISGGGAPKAVNAARGQAATTLKAVADGGRLATITGDPPREERGVAVSDVYVRPDGRQLSALAELLAHGTLSVPIASVRPLEQAAQALREVVTGADGAVVLSLRA